MHSGRFAALGILAALLAGSGAAITAEPEKIMESVESYQNSFDGTGPLLATVSFDATKQRMPMIVFMHGFSGDKNAVLPDVRQFARKGVFAVAPDMRGRGGSAGKPDCGGMEILDIAMAVRHCLQKYPDRIDPDNISLWGYSGGGGNGFACAVRFPDLFNQIAIFFGISDYGRWRGVSPNYAAMVEGWVGGTPEQLPHAYAARNVIPGAGNDPFSRIHLVWDEKETTCPGFFHTDFFDAARAAGCTNVTLHESKASDIRRFKHGYTTDNPDLSWFEETLLFPEIQSGSRAIRLPEKGRFRVRGFIWTKRFALVLENAAGTCDLEYELSPEKAAFRVSHLEAATPKLSLLLFRPEGGAFLASAWLNGKEVPMKLTTPSERRADLSVEEAQ